VNTLVVDKTGTLTEGKPRLVSNPRVRRVHRRRRLRLAASLERGGEHPLAAAIVAGAEERKLARATAENFKSVTGQGVTWSIEGRAVALGNEHMMRELSVAFDAVSANANAQRKDDHMVMFVAIEGLPAGLIGVADPIKASTAEALKMLQDDGVKIVVLTGDNRITAAAVAKKLGIGHRWRAGYDCRGAAWRCLRQCGSIIDTIAGHNRERCNEFPFGFGGSQRPEVKKGQSLGKRESLFSSARAVWC
jgi:Cu+-exporting ATPase